MPKGAGGLSGQFAFVIRLFGFANTSAREHLNFLQGGKAKLSVLFSRRLNDHL